MTDPAENIVNSALLPKPKLEEDFYDWHARHESKAKAAASGKHELAFIGDSITHLFEGHPGFSDRGDRIWNARYAPRKALNLGFGWDRTQNALWRLAHGEFEGQTPKLAVVNIGTNNLTGTQNARTNTPQEIAEGVCAVCRRIHELSPKTAILVMGIFPRGEPNDPLRGNVKKLNAILSSLSTKEGFEFLDIGSRFLDEAGRIPKELMPDLVHPSEAGYMIWAEAIEPIVERHLGPLNANGKQD